MLGLLVFVPSLDISPDRLSNPPQGSAPPVPPPRPDLPVAGRIHSSAGRSVHPNLFRAGTHPVGTRDPAASQEQRPHRHRRPSIDACLPSPLYRLPNWAGSSRPKLALNRPAAPASQGGAGRSSSPAKRIGVAGWSENLQSWRSRERFRAGPKPSQTLPFQ